MKFCLIVGGSGEGYTRPAMGRYGHFAIEGLPAGLALLVVKRGPTERRTGATGLIH